MDDKVRYEVRVLGQLGPAARRAVAEMSVEVMSQATVLSGAFDQAALHDVLERVQALGLEVVEVRRRVRPPASGATPPVVSAGGAVPIGAHATEGRLGLPPVQTGFGHRRH